MNIAFFSNRPYMQAHFSEENRHHGFNITWFDAALNSKTAVLGHGFDAVCVFVNDHLDAEVVHKLAKGGVRYIALRCAGYNNVDWQAATKAGMAVVRVPAYSPEAVAEHSVGLMLTLNRHIHKAYQRTRDANFSLNGMVGFNMHGKTAGIIGAGKIGLATLRILKGLGMRLLVHDPVQDEEAQAMGASYVALDRLFAESDVISLHCPLTSDNHHLLNRHSFARMKDGVMIINTSRGGLLNARDAIDAINSGKIGHLGLDVYEEEEHLFFEDKSCQIIQDETFHLLSAYPNVILTGHQAFLTNEALSAIARVTLDNLQCLADSLPCNNKIN
ncbi:2-hydroxyacid dehydrogenase [Oceanimonas baumannii]|uniref:2-hydroxyacid dehydrogenase n=1 Tax=Oceanimonas baumannii TaxID=129578 RepID=A0A235CFF1_9GAMM|nr:2-hydroxyacid dehydrogenase [Oceanimonas baumannii]OYD23280.1 2-hydroxyacid dehydrogenase [Oceanimonas baumannii]TDW58576.1 D-lactate dehydrogenase [Oceanimonas baumannii]